MLCVVLVAFLQCFLPLLWVMLCKVSLCVFCLVLFCLVIFCSVGAEALHCVHPQSKGLDD
jgi:hypothetical protein